MNNETTWLLLIASLPGQQPATRMRFWRGLKSSGAATLRDGVYLLPSGASAVTALREQATEVVAAGGSAFVVPVTTTGEDDPLQQAWRPLFDRGQDYAEVMQALDALKTSLATLSEGEARRRLAGLRRDYEGVVAVDFSPGEARRQLARAIETAESALNDRFSLDEPRSGSGAIERRDPADYRGRRWATRARLWVDRVASAWLIRRFIDPQARFIWLRDPSRKPRGALGFDFDGAEFSHIGARVSFEVLAASFGLEDDPAISRIGALVHYLDVGGVPVPEAAGFAAIMAGARSTTADDDALLQTIGLTLDQFYAAYSGQDKPGAEPRRPRKPSKPHKPGDAR